MKKIIAFAAATLAVVGVAIGVQAFATTGNEEGKQPPAATAPSGSPSAPNGSSSAKADDGERSGFTEDHAGKPGETK